MPLDLNYTTEMPVEMAEIDSFGVYERERTGDGPDHFLHCEIVVAVPGTW